MAILNVQESTRAGISLTHNAVNGGGDSYLNDGNVATYFRNSSGAPITVTFTISKTVEGSTPAGRVYSVPATSDLFIDPFPEPEYNDVNRRVNMTYSTPTGLTLALVKTRR